MLGADIAVVCAEDNLKTQVIKWIGIKLRLTIHSKRIPTQNEAILKLKNNIFNLFWILFQIIYN